MNDIELAVSEKAERPWGSPEVLRNCQGFEVKQTDAQIGSYLGENDIVRLEARYPRT